MVLKNSKKNTALKERRRRREYMLNIAFVLLLLLLCLSLGYFYIMNRKTENLEPKRSATASSSEKDDAKFYFELLEASEEDSDVQSSTVQQITWKHCGISNSEMNFSLV